MVILSKRNSQWSRNAALYKAYFDDAKDRVSSSTVFPRILDFIGEVKGLRVLDFGCGQGRFSRLLYDLGADVTAFDQSIEELRIAMESNDGRDIAYSSKKETVFRKNYYDIVLCFMVLLCNNKEEAREIVRQIYRITKAGGRVVFVNTNTATLGRKFKDFYSPPVKKEIKEGAPYKTIIPTSRGEITVVDHYYSRDFLRKLFEKNDFEIIFEEVIAKQFLVQILKK